MFFLFFFQAEDGIRDRNVTGVQTCALPISRVREQREHKHSFEGGVWRKANRHLVKSRDRHLANLARGAKRIRRQVKKLIRSEERRVGKECRYRWWQKH